MVRSRPPPRRSTSCTRWPWRLSRPLRSRLHGGRTDDLVAVCARLRGHASHDVETAQLTVTLRSLARRVRTLRAEAAEHETALRDLVDAWRSDLLDAVGVGPIVAAVVLSAWSHSGRVPSEAAFAHLAGAAPIPASSGQTVRHRLCRSGDRQLNRALHTIAMTRMRIDPTTQAYVARRRAEGKTDREIRRCLKRYIGVCRTLPCQAAEASGAWRVCSSRHMRRMTRFASWRLCARRASRRVLPSAALRAR